MGARVDETDVKACVETSAKDLIRELALLRRISECPEEVSAPTLREADIPTDRDPDEIRDAAEERMYELPLAVERTTTFEVVLGVGGPDRRLCFECDRLSVGRGARTAGALPLPLQAAQAAARRARR